MFINEVFSYLFKHAWSFGAWYPAKRFCLVFGIMKDLEIGSVALSNKPLISSYLGVRPRISS